jgi:hypothetical protein
VTKSHLYGYFVDQQTPENVYFITNNISMVI